MLRFFRDLLQACGLGSKQEKKGEDEKSPLPDVHADGMAIVGHSGPYDRAKLPESNNKILLLKEDGVTVTSECKHRSAKDLLFMVYGIEIKGDGSRRCADCSLTELRSDVIRCALCGLPILPGQSVAIYAASSRDVNLDYAFLIDEGESALGCLNMNCCPSGGFFAGYWMGEAEGFAAYDFSKCEVH